MASPRLDLSAIVTQRDRQARAYTAADAARALTAQARKRADKLLADDSATMLEMHRVFHEEIDALAAELLRLSQDADHQRRNDRRRLERDFERKTDAVRRAEAMRSRSAAAQLERKWIDESGAAVQDAVRHAVDAALASADAKAAKALPVPQPVRIEAPPTLAEEEAEEKKRLEKEERLLRELNRFEAEAAALRDELEHERQLHTDARQDADVAEQSAEQLEAELETTRLRARELALSESRAVQELTSARHFLFSQTGRLAPNQPLVATIEAVLDDVAQAYSEKAAAPPAKFSAGRPPSFSEGGASSTGSPSGRRRRQSMVAVPGRSGNNPSPGSAGRRQSMTASCKNSASVTDGGGSGSSAQSFRTCARRVSAAASIAGSFTFRGSQTEESADDKGDGGALSTRRSVAVAASRRPSIASSSKRPSLASNSESAPQPSQPAASQSSVARRSSLRAEPPPPSAGAAEPPRTCTSRRGSLRATPSAADASRVSAAATSSLAAHRPKDEVEFMATVAEDSTPGVQELEGLAAAPAAVEVGHSAVEQDGVSAAVAVGDAQLTLVTEAHGADLVSAAGSEPTDSLTLDGAAVPSIAANSKGMLITSAHAPADGATEGAPPPFRSLGSLGRGLAARMSRQPIPSPRNAQTPSAPAHAPADSAAKGDGVHLGLGRMDDPGRSRTGAADAKISGRLSQPERVSVASLKVDEALDIASCVVITGGSDAATLAAAPSGLHESSTDEDAGAYSDAAPGPWGAATLDPNPESADTCPDESTEVDAEPASDVPGARAGAGSDAPPAPSSGRLPMAAPATSQQAAGALGPPAAPSLAQPRRPAQPPRRGSLVHPVRRERTRCGSPPQRLSATEMACAAAALVTLPLGVRDVDGACAGDEAIDEPAAARLGAPDAGSGSGAASTDLASLLTAYGAGPPKDAPMPPRVAQAVGAPIPGFSATHVVPDEDDFVFVGALRRPASPEAPAHPLETRSHQKSPRLGRAPDAGEGAHLAVDNVRLLIGVPQPVPHAMSVPIPIREPPVVARLAAQVMRAGETTAEALVESAESAPLPTTADERVIHAAAKPLPDHGVRVSPRNAQAAHLTSAFFNAGGATSSSCAPVGAAARAHAPPATSKAPAACPAAAALLATGTYSVKSETCESSMEPRSVFRS